MTKMLKDVEGGEVRRPYNIKEKKGKGCGLSFLDPRRAGG